MQFSAQLFTWTEPICQPTSFISGLTNQVAPPCGRFLMLMSKSRQQKVVTFGKDVHLNKAHLSVDIIWLGIDSSGGTTVPKMFFCWYFEPSNKQKDTTFDQIVHLDKANVIGLHLVQRWLARWRHRTIVFFLLLSLAHQQIGTSRHASATFGKVACLNKTQLGPTVSGRCLIWNWWRHHADFLSTSWTRSWVIFEGF